MTVEVSRVTKPAFLTFLENLTAETAKLFQEYGFSGTLNCETINLSDNLTCIKIQYVNGENLGSPYHILLGKRYYAHNMLKVENVDTHTVTVIEADPKALLAFITL